MAHDENPLGIATVLCDVVVNPMNRFRDVVKDINDYDVRQQAVARGDEDETSFHESLRLKLNACAVTGLPTAAMNPEYHREIGPTLGRVDVEFLARIGRFGIGNIALKPHFD